MSEPDDSAIGARMKQFEQQLAECFIEEKVGKGAIDHHLRGRGNVRGVVINLDEFHAMKNRLQAKVSLIGLQECIRMHTPIGIVDVFPSSIVKAGDVRIAGVVVQVGESLLELEPRDGKSDANPRG